MEGRTATEQDRRDQMEALVFAIADTSTTLTTTPINLRGSRVVDGVIIFSAETKAQQEAIVATCHVVRPARCDSRGKGCLNLNASEDSGVPSQMQPRKVCCLHGQAKPGSSERKYSIRLVSVLPGTNPVAFVDINQRGQNYLETTGYTLNALGVELRLQEVIDGDKK